MLRSFLLILVIVSTSACAKSTFVRSAPDYQATLQRSKLVLVLPPKVEVHTIDALGKKTKMYEYEDKLEVIITDTIIDKLREKNLNVRFLSRKEIHDMKLSHEIINLKDNFEDLTTDLYSSGPWKEEKAFAVDASIKGTSAIHQKLNADLIVMTDFSLSTKTSGAMATDLTKEILLGALSVMAGGRANIRDEPAEIARMKLALIDASSGKLLWMHSVGKDDDMISTTIDSMSDSNKVDQERLNHLCDIAFKDLDPK